MLHDKNETMLANVAPLLKKKNVLTQIISLKKWCIPKNAIPNITVELVLSIEYTLPHDKDRVSRIRKVSLQTSPLFLLLG